LNPLVHTLCLFPFLRMPIKEINTLTQERPPLLFFFGNKRKKLMKERPAAKRHPFFFFSPPYFYTGGMEILGRILNTLENVADDEWLGSGTTLPSPFWSPPPLGGPGDRKSVESGVGPKTIALTGPPFFFPFFAPARQKQHRQGNLRHGTFLGVPFFPPFLGFLSLLFLFYDPSGDRGMDEGYVPLHGHSGGSFSFLPYFRAFWRRQRQHRDLPEALDTFVFFGKDNMDLARMNSAIWLSFFFLSLSRADPCQAHGGLSWIRPMWRMSSFFPTDDRSYGDAAPTSPSSLWGRRQRHPGPGAARGRCLVRVYCPPFFFFFPFSPGLGRLSGRRPRGEKQQRGTNDTIAFVGRPLLAFVAERKTVLFLSLSDRVKLRCQDTIAMYRQFLFFLSPPRSSAEEFIRKD